MIVDVNELKDYIEDAGMKQKSIAEKTGLDESKLCLILQGKRKLEAGEYANICKILKVPMSKFVKEKSPDRKEVG